MSDEPTKSARNEHVAAIPLARTDPDAVEERTWSGRPVPDGYTGMIDEIHELLDRVAAAAPTTDLVTEATKVVADLNARLAEYAVDEADQVSGRLVTVPGRAQLAVPAVHVEHLDDLGMTGRVRFGRHFLGSGAVHGGAIPLLFDDLLGRLALTGGRSPSHAAAWTALNAVSTRQRSRGEAGSCCSSRRAPNDRKIGWCLLGEPRPPSGRQGSKPDSSADRRGPCPGCWSRTEHRHRMVGIYFISD